MVECAAVVQLVREKFPVHFCAETAMSPVRVWEAGHKIFNRIENFDRMINILEKHLRFTCNASKTAIKDIEVSG